MPKAIVIGAGMGGLATALRLAHKGFGVTVVEKLDRPGGRANVIEEAGFRVDIGPTILVMKSALEETYQAVGQNLHQRLDLVQLDPNYRVYFHDGESFDLYSNMARLTQEVESIAPGSSARLFQFMGAGARKYELGMDFVDRNFRRLTDLANPRAAVRLLQTQAHQNLYRQVSRLFGQNDRLAKAFSFHSLFLGLSPYDALAMYSLITYADLAMGMWFPMGGIYSIVEDMVDLAKELGVDLRTASPVSQICVEGGRTTGVLLASGEQLQADLVVSNADLPYTYRSLIAPEHRPRYSDARLRRMSYACSGFLLFLGVDRQYDHLQHQSLFFAEDYRANLDAIFKFKTLPQDPSFHLNVPTVTDPSLAPPGHSLIYVLAPMPNLTSDIDWDVAAPLVRGQLLDRLEEIIDPDVRSHIVWEREYRPGDWKKDVNAEHGTAFGSLAHGFFQSAYFRPHNKSYEIDGLYFVGQGTYPGIGMPMVHLSAKLVTERIVEEWH